MTRHATESFPSTERVIREEWPVTLGYVNPRTQRGNPLTTHPIFGSNWGIQCPHCGGIVVSTDQASNFLNAFCIDCKAQGVLIPPLRIDDSYG